MKLPRVMATDGATASGELTPGSYVDGGRLWRPIPILGPVTRVFTVGGETVYVNWDNKRDCPVDMEGGYGIGQKFDGTKVKFLPDDVEGQ